MKFVNESYVQKKQTEEVELNRIGEKIEKSKEKSYAKIVSTGDSVYYYIRIYQNLPYDPLGPYSRREIFSDTKMKKVSKNTFDFYLMYLKSNNSIYLTKAQRGIIND